MNEHGERILSVRLHDKCEHRDEMWERKPCGHVWCKMCNGHVHPGTRVSLKGLTDVVQCNRKWHRLNEYEFLFVENCAGSARLTHSIKKRLGAERVAPPEDLLYGKQYDLLDDKVYN